MALDFSKNSGSKLINNVVQKSDKITTDGKKHDIDIDLIVFNPHNEKLFGLKGIETFAEHIKDEGFHGAIEVYALTNGKYEIFSGHRRYLALKKLGAKTIPCIVNQNVDETKKIENLIGSNIHNRFLSPLNYARCISIYKDEVLNNKGFKGNRREECAKYFDISPAQVYRYECIMKMIPELQELSDDSSFPYSAFTFAANMSEKLQKELYNEIMSYYEFAKQNTSENNEKDDTFIISKQRIEQMIKSIKTRDEREKKEISQKKNTESEHIKEDSLKSIEHILIEDTDNNNDELENLDIFMKRQGEEFRDSDTEQKINTMSYYGDNEILLYLDKIKFVVEAECKLKNRDIVIRYLESILNDIKKEPGQDFSNE